jgi:predicted  nucleic acid-binding Zn-ribbon protein
VQGVPIRRVGVEIASGRMQMRKMKPEIQRLNEERDRLVREIVALQNQLTGIERAIALVSGEIVEPSPVKRERTRGVKEAVLGAVEGAGGMGINVNELMQRTEREGVHLERGTVSSLLSRFKREGVLSMKDGRYYVVPASEKEAREALFN